MILHHSSAKIRSVQRIRGFTMSDLMVSTALFGMVVVGLISAQLFGMKIDQIVSSKAGASDKSRIGYDTLTTDIRAAKVWRIGNGTASSFSPCSNATLQVGNALQLSFTTDTNTYVRYYFDTNRAQLLKVSSSGSYTDKIISDSLTNASGNGMTFRAEDYRGTNASDLTYKNVIVTTFEFCQYMYPLTRVGPGYYYDYYRLQFRVSSHNFD